MKLRKGLLILIAFVIVTTFSIGGVFEKKLKVSGASNNKPTFICDTAKITARIYQIKNTSSTFDASATDIDGDKLTYSIKKSPDKSGIAEISDAGLVTYTPNKDYVGTDSLQVSVKDAKGRYSNLNILIHILSVDIPTKSPLSIPLLNASENYLTNLNLSGHVGEILGSNERSWLLNVMNDNPNMFSAFANPEANILAKCMWHGEFPGKILTGMAQTYRAFNNPDTLEAGNKMVQMFKAVQGADGYLGPWSLSKRFNGDKGKWDTWGNYHCIYGLYQWYKVTGNQEALDIAIKAADCIYNYFIEGKQTFVSQNWAECNFAISHVFAILYQETNNKKYREASEHIVQNEWKLEYKDFYLNKLITCDWLGAAKVGKAFYQTNQTRWESLHTLMTLSPLYQSTNNIEYYQALEHYWWSIIQYDRNNFGGFGTGESAAGDVYGHGSETCSTVAWMAYSTEYLKLSKISYVADELEIAYFNAAMGSLLDDHDYVYMNDSNGTRVSALIALAGHGFEGGKELSCCQANGNRGLSQLTEWAVLTDKENLYLNYYGSSNAITQTPNKNSIKILQETEYPKNKFDKITLTLDKSEQFKFNLRIPTWSANTVIKVNGETLNNVMAGDYYVINRVWKNGDIIEIEFDLSIHFWVGDDKLLNKTSTYYGPILLAMNPSSTGASSKLDVSKIKNIAFEENEDFWFYGTIENNDGKIVTLVDYSSAGKKRERYTTWLNVVHSLEAFPYITGNNPLWNNVGINTYTITASAGENGSISPAGNATVAYGNRQTYNFTADKGYKIDKILVNGTPVDVNGTQYSFAHTTKDNTIEVYFKKASVSKIIIVSFVIFTVIGLLIYIYIYKKKKELNKTQL